MNARMYFAFVLFVNFACVQPNVVYRERESKGKLVGDVLHTQKPFDTISRDGSGKSRRALGVKDQSRLWPNGIIPYHIDFDDAKKKSTIRKAMDEWENYTCLKFTPKTKGDHYVLRIANKDQGCLSDSIGRDISSQPTNLLNLGSTCWHHKIILHELGHVIGLAHEQSRPDRDTFVTIYNKKNLDKDLDKLKISEYDYWSTGYDYYSIMHYPADNTMQTNDPAMQNIIGQAQHLSFRDIKAVNIMYNCQDADPTMTCTLKHTSCPGDGYVDRRCSCACPINGFNQPPGPCSSQPISGASVVTH